MESRESLWVGFDVGKNSFSAALDCHGKNIRARITSLPCRDFKRTPEGVEQFFLWAKKTLPGHDTRIGSANCGIRFKRTFLVFEPKSGRLRQILYLDSIPGVPKIPVLQEFHQRFICKGKKKMTARCACMRKMLLILRSMVVHHTPFNENFPNNQQKRLDF